MRTFIATLAIIATITPASAYMEAMDRGESIPTENGFCVLEQNTGSILGYIQAFLAKRGVCLSSVEILESDVELK